MQHTRVTPHHLFPAIAGNIHKGLIYILNLCVKAGDDNTFRALLHCLHQFKQLLLSQFALGNVFRENDDAADRFIGHKPGSDFPSQPLSRTVFTLQAILSGLDHIPIYALLIDLFPVRRDFRTSRIMRNTDNIAAC